MQPFFVGQCARGERFYGRKAQIAEILDGPRDCLWVLGTRRIGKTSLLRHVERLAERSPERGFVPLFWELRRATSLAELSRTFRDSLCEAGHDRLEFRRADQENEDLFPSIGRLRRRLGSQHLKLLLLCDEADELIRLRDEHPAVFRRLCRALQPGEGMRTVLASTPRLWALAEQRDDASPILQAFIPPLYLQALPEEEARSLISQSNLPSALRPEIDDETAERMRKTSGGHPYLLQMLCKRSLELGGVDEAFRRIAAGRVVSTLFASDLDSLPEIDQALLAALAERAPADSGKLQTQLACDASAFKASLFRLESLGLVRRDPQHRLTLGNRFLGPWLAATSRGSPERQAVLPAAELTRLDPTALSPDDLFESVYQPLRGLARRYLRRERPGHTLQPTALVHEAYLKLVDQSRVDWKGRTHFFAVGAKVMRRILIDHARSRRRAKRGGEWLRVTLSGLKGSPVGRDLDPAQLLALHAALEELARIDERQARVVELRFFAGLTMSEVAKALGVSKRTADADWAKACTWLERELGARAARPRA